MFRLIGQLMNLSVNHVGFGYLRADEAASRNLLSHSTWLELQPLQ